GVSFFSLLFCLFFLSLFSNIHFLFLLGSRFLQIITGRCFIFSLLFCLFFLSLFSNIHFLFLLGPRFLQIITGRCFIFFRCCFASSFRHCFLTLELRSISVIIELNRSVIGFRSVNLIEF